MTYRFKLTSLRSGPCSSDATFITYPRQSTFKPQLYFSLRKKWRNCSVESHGNVFDSSIPPLCTSRSSGKISKGLAANDLAKAKRKEWSPDLNGHHAANLICVLFQPECCVFCLWASSEAAKFLFGIYKR